MDEKELKQYRKELFIKLLMLLRTLARENLGLGSGQSPKNPEIAREFIDMVELISIKAEPNLLKQEKELIESLLTELRLTYVKSVGG